jgi:hypothetical protein
MPIAVLDEVGGAPRVMSVLCPVSNALRGNVEVSVEASLDVG